MTTELPTARTLRTMQGAMHALFVVLLVVGLVCAALAAGGPARVGVVVLATLAFAALYLGGLVIERRSTRHEHGAHASRGGQAWITALVVAWAGLLCLAADFAWVAFALYFLVLHVARRPLAAALTAVTLLASVAALSLDDRTRGAGAVIGPVMGMLVALGIAWVYAQLRRESEARAELVRQLLAAQDDVLASGEALALAQHDAGVLAERERLARDIHDTLAQHFSSALLLSRAALAREGGAPHTDLLRQIEGTAAAGLAQSREVVHALSPAELREAPLFAALERLAATLERESGVAVTCRSEGEARALPAAVDVALLRIAQGTVANVRQHAGATRAALTLTYSDDGVTLEIIDDGRGFTEADVARAPLGGSGFGLRGTRERVAALGGTLTIESAPGEGAAVVVTLPTHVRPGGGR